MGRGGLSILSPASWCSQGVIIPLRALLLIIWLGKCLFLGGHRGVERLVGDQGMILEMLSVAETRAPGSDTQCWAAQKVGHEQSWLQSRAEDACRVPD